MPIGMVQAVEVIWGHLTASGIPQGTCDPLRGRYGPILYTQDRAGTGSTLTCKVIKGQLICGEILRQCHVSRIPLYGTIRN